MMAGTLANVYWGLFLFFIICFGIAGNIISYIVWTKGPRCKKLAGGIYLRALAVSDTIVLCIPATNEAIYLLFSINPSHQNNIFCKLENTGRHFGLLVSAWIIACFSVERTFTVFQPHKSSKWVSKKRTIILVGFIFMINFFLNLPYGIVYEMVETSVFQRRTFKGDNTTNSNVTDHGNISVNDNNESKQYKRTCTSDPLSIFAFYSWYHIWFMDFILIFVIPFLLIVISNSMVLLLIAVRGKTLRSTQGSRRFGVTVRAVSVSIVHCITSGPFSVIYFSPKFASGADEIKYSLEYYVMKAVLILAYLNHAINFILYSLLGTDFRRDCAQFVCRKGTAIHPGNLTESLTRNTWRSSRKWKHSAANRTRRQNNHENSTSDVASTAVAVIS